MLRIQKRSHLLIVFLITVACCVGGCSKDNDEGIEPVIDPTNSLEYKGKTYSLHEGAVVDYGYDGEHYNQEFHLIQFSEDDETLVPVYFFLDLFSASEESFKQGVFTFAEDDADVAGKHYFDDGYFIRNMRVGSEEADEVVFVTGGTVKVAGSGLDYAIEFDVVLENGEKVKGSFGGTFENVVPDDASQSRLQGKANNLRNFSRRLVK